MKSNKADFKRTKQNSRNEKYNNSIKNPMGRFNNKLDIAEERIS